jgi:replicative DNA helicase
MVDAANIATLIVAKQRQGPTGSVSVRFDTETTRFTNFVRT